MVSTTKPVGRKSDEAPAQEPFFDKLAALLNFAISNSTEQTKAENQPPLDPLLNDVDHVAIVLDGVGSTSGEPNVFPLAQAITARTAFDAVIFSYCGKDELRYGPKDTYSVGLKPLVKHLDNYIRYYSNAKSILLVGFSLGGLIAIQWLHEYGKHTSSAGGDISNNYEQPPRVVGLCLIASPILANAYELDYEFDNVELGAAKDYLAAIWSDYDAGPYSIPDDVPVIVLRCQRDRTIDDRLFHLCDRFDGAVCFDRVIEGVRHVTIAPHATTLQEAIVLIDQVHLLAN